MHASFTGTAQVYTVAPSGVELPSGSSVPYRVDIADFAEPSGAGADSVAVSSGGDILTATSPGCAASSVIRVNPGTGG